ncbi:MAG: YggS family pyridoxal phosphate-dependent enzyme [Deltaproteobacteria bacterium]
MERVTERLSAIHERIARAARQSGREAGAVRLVAVSKTKPASDLRAAYVAGQRDFGESYAQELRDKARELSDLTDLRWHFIGHLQANKAKYVAPVASLVHAVDSWETARELSRRAAGRALRCLIEVNLASEPQKAGVPPEETQPFAQSLLALPSLELSGLMCLPPAGEPARRHFERLRRLRDELSVALSRPLPELSMGMSDDFEDAIAEGATLVRVGTAIFGDRD